MVWSPISMLTKSITLRQTNSLGLGHIHILITNLFLVFIVVFLPCYDIFIAHQRPSSFLHLPRTMYSYWSNLHAAVSHKVADINDKLLTKCQQLTNCCWYLLVHLYQFYSLKMLHFCNCYFFFFFWNASVRTYRLQLLHNQWPQHAKHWGSEDVRQ